MAEFIVKWIYVLEKDYVYPTGKRIGKDYLFKDKDNKAWLKINKNGDFTIIKGYAWDGATPKFCLFDIYFGVPDGVLHPDTLKPKTYYASLLHDVGYQFLKDGLPYSRKEVDQLFLKIMGAYDFRPRYIYYFAVRLLGGVAVSMTRWKRATKGKKEEVKTGGEAI
ncbi:hypothetical protein MNBD_NITROSPINAE02-1569 [hydrothermal vent metagenome]|uniref:DUF1353 domain-containing protein n=1 Tax=hydrothermal vent metagenome TaxID=652676 RepID=A0A3B1BF61_9ZZZZ